MKSNILKLGVCLLATLAMFSCKKQETSAYSSDPTFVALTVGEQTQIKAMCYGVKSSDGTEVGGVTWSTSNKYVAEVDANGVVTARKVGTADISGSFQNGKLVICTVAVLGTSNLFIEPYIGVSMSEAIANEELDQDSIVRKGENYFVAFDKSGNSKYSDYKFYSYGAKSCAFADVQGKAAYDELIGKFLPERFDAVNGFYMDNLNRRAYAPTTPFEYVAIYTPNDNAANVDEAVLAYRTSCVTYLTVCSSPATYSKAALELVNDITYEALDQNTVNTIVNAGKQIAATSNSVKEIEETLSNDREALETEFVKAARVSGMNICHANLSDPYDKNNYYDAAWDKILEYDVNTQVDLDAATTIKAVDAAITNNKALYATIVSKRVVDLYKNDLTKAYQKYNESDYTAENWATLTGYYNAGLSDLETSITTKEAETKNKETKAQMKAVPKK